MMILVAGSPPLLLMDGLLRALAIEPLEPGDVEQLTFECFTVRGQIGPSKTDGYSYEWYRYGDAWFRATAWNFPKTTLLIVMRAPPTHETSGNS